MLLEAGQSWRVVTLRTAGVLLIALALVMALASPGIGIIAMALPPVAVGVWTLALRPLARPLAILAGLAYGAIIAFVATTPLRGLTPPPGQSRDPLDPATVALAVGFLVVAGLAAIGKPVRR